MSGVKQLISYLTVQSTPPMSTYVSIAFGIAGVFLLVGISIPLLQFLLQRRKQSLKHLWLWQRLANVFRIAGCVWLVLLLLRFEGLAPFTMRVWLVLSVVPFLIWTVWLVSRYGKMVPQIVYEDTLKTRFEKYLPQQSSKRRKKR
ncbi:MAG TPA: hypothetical protein VGE59_01985 [Patescibacteria group bacterium]